MSPSSGVRAGWLGFALAALFFYPLASALEGDPYYLQWQPMHSAEALAALAMLSLLAGWGLHYLLPRQGRGATAILGLVALLSLLSFAGGVSRQLPFAGALRSAWEDPLWRYGVPGLVALATLTVFMLRPQGVRRALEHVLLVLSPISLVVVLSLVSAGLRPPAPLATRQPVQTTAPAGCRSVLALLFDEFSFAYLYDGTTIRPEFPRLRAFATGATSYLNARSPGRDTMTSVPGFLTGQVFDEVHPDGRNLRYVQGREGGHVDARSPEGLLQTARRAGLSPEVVGYYFAYCELVGAAADSCRSFSFYNVSTVRRSFSPVHPILTTIILWPRQFPLGILKSRVFGWHQRDLVSATARELARALDPAHPVFRLVHFSIPHLPFVFSERGFDPPADPLRQRPDDGYVRQLRYADALFGTVVDRLRREQSYDETTIVFLSDHGHRSSGRDTDPRHIPFLVKAAGQSRPRQVTEPVAGARLLHDIVAAACTPGSPHGGTPTPETRPAGPDQP